MKHLLDGYAVVYCEGVFNTTYGKTGHGLVRRSNRYDIVAVLDSTYAGRDSGLVLDGKENGIPILDSLDRIISYSKKIGREITHFVIGLASDGGRLENRHRQSIVEAINFGLNIDSGLHDFLTEDDQFLTLALRNQVTMRDIRKPLDRKDLHFFCGKINEVESLKLAILGTDSAVVKRTTATKTKKVEAEE